MALFEWLVANVGQWLSLFYSLILCYLFYLALKLAAAYHRTHEPKHLLLATVVLLGAFEIWSRIHETDIKAFFEQFRFLLVAVPLGVFLIYTIQEGRRAKESEEKKKLRAAFHQYLAPSVVEEVIKNPDRLKLGGEKKTLTVFFSDVRGFTSISEKLSPEKLVLLLNEYLNAMTSIILDNKGLVDKFIGDAIMAIWGAPVDDRQHAAHACTSAILMKRRLVDLTKDFEKRGLPRIDIGMGINTGEMVVGNMGSDQRFDYTVMGDNVNLASRLEGQTKNYHVSIIITEGTYEHVKGAGFTCRELDLIAVKGKSKPIRIYELCETNENADAHLAKRNALFEKALSHYFHKRFDDALVLFKQCRKEHHDETSDVFIGRCEEYKKNPPPATWDGAYVASSK